MRQISTITVKLAKCPACYHSFQVPEKIKLSEVTKCPNCKKMLEVVNLFPLTMGRVNSQLDKK